MYNRRLGDVIAINIFLPGFTFLRYDFGAHEAASARQSCDPLNVAREFKDYSISRAILDANARTSISACPSAVEI